MRILVQVIALMTFQGSIAFAQMARVSTNAAFIDKLATTILMRQDAAVLDSLQKVTANKNWRLDPMAAGRLRSTYDPVDGLKKGAKLVGKGISMSGARGQIIGSAVELAVDGFEFGKETYDFYLAPTKNILASEDIKKKLKSYFAAAENNGSLPFVLKNLSQRYSSKIENGQFPPDVELAMSVPGFDKKLNAVLSQAGDQAKQAAALQAIVDEIQKDLKTLIVPPEVLERQETVKKNQEKFDQQQLKIDTRAAQLSLVGSLASILQIKGAQKPLALGNLWVEISSAANARSLAINNAFGNSAKIANANWVMAANTATACIMAYQMLAGGQSGDAAIMAALKQIAEQLKIMDQKLDYLIELSETNFARFKGMLGHQGLVLDVILKLTNKSLELQYQNQLAPFIQESNRISEEYAVSLKYCQQRNAACVPAEFYKKVYADLVSRKSVDSRSIDGEDNLAFLTMPLSYGETKAYRQYQSSPFLVRNLREVLTRRLNENSLNQEKQQVYERLLATLKTSDATGFADVPNGKTWKEAADFVHSLQKQTAQKAPKFVTEQIFAEGKRLVNYENKFLRNPLMHYAFMFELQEDAKTLVASANSVFDSLVNAYVTEFNADGSVKRAASEAYQAKGGLASCGGGEYAWSSIDANPVETDKFFAVDARTEGFGYFRILEQLGYGQITKCIYWWSRRNVSPAEMSGYGFKQYPGSIVPMAIIYKFVWSKNKVDPLTEDEKPVVLTRINYASPSWKSWRYNQNNERNLIYQKGKVVSISKENIAKYKALIQRVLNEEIAAELAVTENLVPTIREAKKGREQFPVFQSVGGAEFLSNMKQTFNRYRTSFYLYNAFVQQMVLAGTSNLLCQSLLAPPKSIATRVDKESPRNINLHPQALIDGIQIGAFHSPAFNVSNYIDTLMRIDRNSFHCQATAYSPYLIDGFDRLGRTLNGK